MYDNKNNLSEKIKWICKDCGLKGYSIKSAPQAIDPMHPMTCDEMIIKDIIE